MYTFNKRKTENLLRKGKNMVNVKSAAIIAVALVLGLTAGCKQAEQPAPTQAASEPVPEVQTPKATFSRGVLTKAVSASGEIQAAKEFSSSDTINAVAILKGNTDKADIRVEVINEDGVSVFDGKASDAVKEKAAIAVKLVPPGSIWPQGGYLARFYLDNTPSWEVRFSVSK